MKFKGEMLGEMEEVILLIIASNKSADMNMITRLIGRHFEKKVSSSAVFTALRRLEGKDYLNSNFGEKQPKRGGKARRMYVLTAKGYEVLSFFHSVKHKLFVEIVGQGRV